MKEHHKICEVCGKKIIIKGDTITFNCNCGKEVILKHGAGRRSETIKK